MQLTYPYTPIHPVPVMEKALALDTIGVLSTLLDDPDYITFIPREKRDWISTVLRRQHKRVGDLRCILGLDPGSQSDDLVCALAMLFEPTTDHVPIFREEREALARVVEGLRSTIAALEMELAGAEASHKTIVGLETELADATAEREAITEENHGLRELLRWVVGTLQESGNRDVEVVEEALNEYERRVRVFEG